MGSPVRAGEAARSYPLLSLELIILQTGIRARKLTAIAAGRGGPRATMPIIPLHA